jgi:hypothetical protein
MSEGQSCAPSTQDLFGWPAGSLQRCEYDVTDQLSQGKTLTKKGIVYLADPSPQRELSWLISACKRVIRDGSLDDCVRSEAEKVLSASGNQFPVAGLVWENMGDQDFFGGYAFRNGVTVRTSQWTNGDTQSADDVLEPLATAPDVTGLARGKGYARILSTTREAYHRFDPKADVPVGQDDAAAAIKWSDLVGSLYRAALSQDENPLITAQVCEDYAANACRR